jgi:hypothetical protein
MLLLKNELKDEFKKAKLDDFTVDRNSNGFLVLVGSCGQPIVEITNFAVSSKLTKTERKIAIEDHILPALHKYKKDILKMIAANESIGKIKKDIDDFAEKHKTKELCFRNRLVGNYNATPTIAYSSMHINLQKNNEADISIEKKYDGTINDQTTNIQAKSRKEAKDVLDLVDKNYKDLEHIADLNYKLLTETRTFDEIKEKFIKKCSI